MRGEGKTSRVELTYIIKMEEEGEKKTKQEPFMDPDAPEAKTPYVIWPMTHCEQLGSHFSPSSSLVNSKNLFFVCVVCVCVCVCVLELGRDVWAINLNLTPSPFPSKVCTQNFLLSLRVVGQGFELRAVKTDSFVFFWRKRERKKISVWETRVRHRNSEMW